ncbi:hypothetical protein ACMGDH_16825 [Sphingomonas sp. DT-207]|uniref:hypothetical protein n=1 Tax=Sphingomonas sp. DT-207 TaxID=3396167 RepID=UPI003F19B7CA
MRIAPLVLAATLILPPPAAAQSLGSYTGATAPSPRAGNWGGDIAQPRGGYRTERAGTPRADFSYGRELGKIRREIREAQDNGQITHSEERALLRQSRRIGGFGYRASAGGFSYSENSGLRGQIELLRSQVTAARTRGIMR